MPRQHDVHPAAPARAGRRPIGVPAGVAGLAVLGVAGLLAAGCGANAKAGGHTVNVALTNDGCKPTPASVQAGPTTFKVTNSGAGKVTEAELKQHNVIVGEKENLTPGLSGTFSLTLKAGKYDLYCPNAKKDTWQLTVTGSAAGSSAAPALKQALTAATTGYQQYVISEVGQLNTATQAFTAAVKAGDVAKAKSLFASTRFHYETVEPVAESFGDLDPRIDARIDDVSDPGKWTGFHRIEKALWQDNSLAGMAPLADQLNTDVADLQQRVATSTYQPAQLANGATELLNEVGAKKVTGEEDRYSHTDLSDFQANLSGSKKAFDLLAPALRQVDANLADTVTQDFAAVQAAIAPYRQADGSWVDYSTVGDDKRRVLTQKVDALAEPLSKVAAKVSV